MCRAAERRRQALGKLEAEKHLLLTSMVPSAQRGGAWIALPPRLEDSLLLTRAALALAKMAITSSVLLLLT